MRPRFRFALIVVAIIVACALLLQFTGYVLVRDETGLAKKAQLTNSVYSQDMTALPFGMFFAIPDLEGEVRVTCSDGSEVSGGYATNFWTERLVVQGEGTCEKLV